MKEDLNFPKKTPFVLPKNYFESLPQRLCLRIEGEEKPKESSQKSPFGVPKNYFEQLPQYVTRRIAEKDTNKPLYKIPPLRWAIVTGSFSAILVLIWFFYPNISPEQQLQVSLSKISKEDLTYYLAYQYPQEVLYQLPESSLPVSEQKQVLEKVDRDSSKLKISGEAKTEMIENQNNENYIDELLEEELNEQNLENILNP